MTLNNMNKWLPSNQPGGVTMYTIKREDSYDKKFKVDLEVPPPPFDNTHGQRDAITVTFRCPDTTENFYIYTISLKNKWRGAENINTYSDDSVPSYIEDKELIV